MVEKASGSLLVCGEGCDIVCGVAGACLVNSDRILPPATTFEGAFMGMISGSNLRKETKHKPDDLGWFPGGQDQEDISSLFDVREPVWRRIIRRKRVLATMLVLLVAFSVIYAYSDVYR